MSTSQSAVKPTLGPSERLLNLSALRPGQGVPGSRRKDAAGRRRYRPRRGKSGHASAGARHRGAEGGPRRPGGPEPPLPLASTACPSSGPRSPTWYASRFGVTVDPAREAMALVGSKEGIAKFFLAHFNPGDTMLLCTPCYPAYLGVAAIAQAARRRGAADRQERHSAPTCRRSRSRTRAARRIMCVNFPNNPTGGVETPSSTRTCCASRASTTCS